MPSIHGAFAAWCVVLVSGLFEIAFAVSMKLSDHFTRPLPAAISVVSGAASVWLLSLTLAVLPLGTAYAVWSGIGVAGSTLVGIGWFGEASSLARLACIALVAAGIVGLQLQGAS